MTENKRFELNCKLGLVNGEEPLCKCLLDNGKHKSYREWVDLLNNLTDENKQLKKENDELKETNHNLGDFRKFINEQNISNEKQRKELQLQMLRLYNYFEDWFEDSMSSNAFSEMWDNVKKDEKWE